MTESNSTSRQWCRRIFGILLPLVIVALGALGAKYFLDTRPKPAKKARIIQAPLVTVQRAAFGREQVIVQAMGTVVPARETELSPQVAGRIIHLARGFEPGGILARGTRVVGIDPKDFQLNVQQQQMALVQAEADLALELGQQEVARKEWELLRGKKSMSSQEAYLALRKPQLEQARADVAKARLDLQQAELDLERTSVLAPFNCLVLEKNVDLGAQVSTQTTIATLVGTDAYWVETSIPRDRLAWIHVPKGGKGTGSAARIRSASTDNERPGQVIRLLGDIESEGRMARVLVRVDDPLFLKENDPSLVPLLLGEYVHVDIQGRVLDHVVAIPRDALRDGNTIWIATSENTLDIRPADIVWRDAHVAYLGGGVQEGERIIISDIAAPVQNMDIRIADEASGSAGDTSKGSAKNS